MKKEQLPALTGLRFLAALWVVLFHFTMYWRPGAWLSLPGGWAITRMLLHGDLGVILFFVLSGFILTYTYEQAGTVRGGARAFYLARFARIYPTYALALVVALGPAAWNWQAGSPALAIPATPLLLQAWIPAGLVWNAPGWSLSTEALFYALFPLLLPVIASWTQLRLWLLIVLAGALCTAGHLLAHLDPFWPVLHLQTFVAGIAVGLAYQRGVRLPGWWAPAAACAVIALCLSASDLLTAIPLLVVPLFAMLILTLAPGRGLLGQQTFVLLGEASYALYLLHYPLWEWLAHLARTQADQPGGVGALAALTGYLVVTIFCSVLVFRTVETPARRAIRTSSEQWLVRSHHFNLTSRQKVTAVDGKAHPGDCRSGQPLT